MIMLDTNVVSELMRPAPAPKVLGWANGVNRASLFMTTITLAETLSGIVKLPLGARRDQLAASAGIMFVDRFHGRILPFNSSPRCITPTSPRSGRSAVARWPRSTPDRRHRPRQRMAVATRNVEDFADAASTSSTPGE